MGARPASSGLGPSRRDLLRIGGLLSAGALGPGLAGCGGSSQRGGGGGSAAELEFMYWGSSFEKTAIQQMLTQFADDHDGVSVRPIHVPGDYPTKVNTLVASKEFPDVAYMDPPTGYRLAEQGRLANLYDHIDSTPALADRLSGDFFWWDEKKAYGTPAANEIILLWFNRSLFSEAGVDPPPAEAAAAWSWDDTVDVAERLTFDQDGRRPGEQGFDASTIQQFGMSAPISYWYPLVKSNGGNIVDASGTKFILNSPEAVEVFQNLQDLIYEHRVAPSPAQLGGGGSNSNAPTTTVQLQTKRVAMAVDGQWILLDMAQSDLDYGIGVLPSYQEPTTMRTGSARVISAATKHPEEALELYLFALNPEYSDLFAKGLWMPVEKRYYTEQKAIDSWTKNDAHPPEYRTAAVDYLIDHSVTDFTRRLRNMPAIDEVLTPALQRIETGKVPAQQVLDDLKDKVEPLLQGWYPTPDL